MSENSTSVTGAPGVPQTASSAETGMRASGDGVPCASSLGAGELLDAEANGWVAEEGAPAARTPVAREQPAPHTSIVATTGRKASLARCDSATWLRRFFKGTRAFLVDWVFRARRKSDTPSRLYRSVH